ncbi:hypothetical protein EYR40_006214 [Pleurotus pulmonarius]|nr:hypothetical protein EYR36_010835 [Pleurotus pulmonarius]KAF4599125.1 hypothetical protein EYR40_006214 [Pleurotus pulmonarius]
MLLRRAIAIICLAALACNASRPGEGGKHDDDDDDNTASSSTTNTTSSSSELAGTAGDSHCGSAMCISAIVNDTSVTYILQSTGARSLGWMAMGFGRSMTNSPMVLAWAPSSGGITISQRIATQKVMPTVDSSPSKVATLHNGLSVASGDQPKFAFSVPKDDTTSQWVIYAFGTDVPAAAADASINQHVETGTAQLDLTKALSSSGSSATDPASSGATSDIPFTPVQRIIVVHAVFCIVGFLLFLPTGALLARYLRTLWPQWFKAHWIVQLGIAGPTIIVGVVLGIYAVHKAGGVHLSTTHRKWGVALFCLYFFQCALGVFIHFVKPTPKPTAYAAHPAARRPLQNYLHAVIGLLTIGLSFYQVRTGYTTEWPLSTGRGEVRSGANIVWYIWVVLLPVLYMLGLALLPRQFRQEASNARNGVKADGEDEDRDRINAPIQTRYRDAF